VSDHAATLLALGLTLALITGVRGERFMQSMRDLYAAQARLRNAKKAMRAARLVFAGVLAVVFAVVWPWLHG
jgi:hypothetical protein